MSDAPKEIVAGSVPEIVQAEAITEVAGGAVAVPDAVEGIAGGSAPAAEVVAEVPVEAGGRRKGGRNRSPKTRALSRVRKLYRSRNCPRGSRKDYRKGSKRNPSGCRRNDRSKSPRRSYHRKMTKAEKSSESRAAAEGAKVGHRKGHDIFKLEKKEGKHRKGSKYYVHQGKKVFATSRQFKRSMAKRSP